MPSRRLRCCAPTRYRPRAATASLLAVLWLLVLSACATPADPPVAPQADKLVLFSPATVIQDDWLHLQFKGATEYRLAQAGGRLAIRAIGRNSASGLLRDVEVDTRHCRKIAWNWRVERLQTDADLRDRSKEDVAAALFVLFGHPGSVLSPNPVPTLRYVWTTQRETPETIIDSPYMPGVVRSLVVRAGSAGLGAWHREQRDLLADFRRAFGHEPPEPVRAVAIFVDNDQTGQPVEAYFGPAEVTCAAEN